MEQQQQTVDQTVSDVDAVLTEQRRIIDAAVRQARRQGWCEEFERIMNQLFPDGPPGGDVEFVDSDGLSCRGYDREGFLNGFNREGFDREGYNHDGRDADGYNRAGVDRNGWSRDGWNADRTVNRDSDEYRERFRWARNGFDREGFDRDGRHRDTGLDREQHAAYMARQDRDTYRFDEDGYDVNGLNRYGERRN